MNHQTGAVQTLVLLVLLGAIVAISYYGLRSQPLIQSHASGKNCVPLIGTGKSYCPPPLTSPIALPTPTAEKFCDINGAVDQQCVDDMAAMCDNTQYATGCALFCLQYPGSCPHAQNVVKTKCLSTICDKLLQ